MAPLLSSTWVDGPGNGTLQLTLDYGGAQRLKGDRLCVMTQLFPLSPNAVSGATLQRADGSFHAFALPDGEDATISMEMSDLAFAPRHSGEGPRSAFLQRMNGDKLPVEVSKMQRHAIIAEVKPEPSQLAPFSGPFCVPWPTDLQISGLVSAPELNFSALGSVKSVAQLLAATLGLQSAISESADAQTVLLSTDGSLKQDSYRLRFQADQIVVEAGQGGAIPAIATLLQLALGAANGFGFPAQGSVIEDLPAYSWRGFHLDCARHFFSVEEIEHILSVMALLKLNRFHWHLTDDEAWRPEIQAFPELTRVGGTRGPDHSIPPQFADGATEHGGTYTRSDMARVVEKARSLGIEVMPEIDLPGHSSALLKAMPQLIDPGETADSYRSVQNFANNSLNPAVPGTTKTVETILAELLEIFPNTQIHLGGDELPEGAWRCSPKAQALASSKGLGSVTDLQGAFFGGLQKFLGHHGRHLAVWDEQGRARNAQGSALIFCWQDPDVAADLTRAGYQVVLCPAQSCYLDIAQSTDWHASGSGWAGVVTPRDSYDFDPLNGIDPEYTDNVVGVQACLWTETVSTLSEFEEMAFPRLFAVAENAWTIAGRKSFDRFDGFAAVLSGALRSR